eukprot:1160744-Pelagomonas_calceolata.AAC.11
MLALRWPYSPNARDHVAHTATSGCLKEVRVLGEGYTPDDEEDSAVATVSNVFIYQSQPPLLPPSLALTLPPPAPQTAVLELPAPQTAFFTSTATYFSCLLYRQQDISCLLRTNKFECPWHVRVHSQQHVLVPLSASHSSITCLPFTHRDFVHARYRVPIARATAGNLVLVEGIDATITKTATVVSDALDSEMHIFK